MNFAVNWADEASAHLAEVWTAAADRDAVTAASYRLEASLRRDPLDTGESREGTGRIAFDPPLVIVFHVDSAARRVVVTAVYPSRRPR